MKKFNAALLRSKNLWMWVGVVVLAAIALAGAIFLLPSGNPQITPTLTDANGQIEPDTAFILTVSGADEEKIRERLQLSPDVPYRLEKQKDGSYILTPNRPLEAGGSFKITYNNQAVEYTVAKTLLVTSFMPINGSTDVPVHSGIEFEFNQKNLSLADFKAAFSVSPWIVGEVAVGDGRFVLYPQQAMEYGTTYTVTLKAPLATPSGFALRETTTFSFTTITALAEATDYLFNLSQTGATLNVLSDEAPQTMIYLDERVTQERIPELEVKIYQYATADDYLEKMSMEAYQPNYGKGGRSVRISTEGLQQYATFVAKPVAAAGDATGKGYNSNQYVLTFPEPLPLGHYAVEYSLPTTEKDASGQPFVIKRYQFMQSTNLSVFFMQTGDDLLLWVNDIISGRPVKDANFSLSGDIIASATTGADGTALIRREGMSVADWQDNIGVFTIKTGDTVFADSQMFTPSYENPSQDYMSYLFTDRPIYRTSDTIKVWGMVRPRNTTTPVPTALTLVMDGVEPIAVKPDAKGLFTAEISYKNMAPNYWSSLQLRLNDAAVEDADDQLIIRDVSIRIEDYVKPVYTAAATATQPVYLLGHGAAPTINMDVTLFDGTPVPGFKANVESWSGDVGFDWGGGALKTNDKGHLAVQMNIRSSENSWYPSSYTVCFSNSDAESENFYAYGDVYAIHRDLMITGTPEQKGDKVDVTIRTNKIDISRVKTTDDLWKENILKGVPTSTPVTAVLKKSYYEKVPTGTTYDFINRVSVPSFRYENREMDIETFDFSTQNGTYVLKDLPRGNDEESYYLQLVSTDSLGRMVEYIVNLSYRPEHYWQEDGSYRYSLAKQFDATVAKGRTSSNSYYFPDYWEQRSSFTDGETVTFLLQRNERPVEQMKGRLLTTTVQKSFENIAISEKPLVTLPYSEALLPNYIITGAYFDGRHAFILQDSYMHFNTEKRELDIKLTTDKPGYAPADPVKLDATVTNKVTGKPAPGAEIVVAVVDEAVFAIQEQNTNILSTLYDAIYYPQISKYSSYMPPEYGGAGEKGGGGGEDIRSDFKDAAFFGTAKTDAQGKAQFAFTLPDNITGWRASALAVTDNNQAGNAKTNLSATKKFFVSPVLNDTLLAGDSFAVGLRGAGTAVSETDEVRYTVEVKGPSYEQTLTAQALLRDYATVVFAPPTAGDYTVTVRASCKGNTDAVRLPFRVIPTGIERTLAQTFNLKDGIKIEPLRYPVRVELYNESYRTYNRVLQNLICKGDGVRSDMRIAQKYLAKLMEEDGGYWYRSSEDMDISDLTQGMLSVLPYTKKDIDLTASMMLALPSMLNVNNVSYLTPGDLGETDGSPCSLYLIQALAEKTTAEEIKGVLEQNPNFTFVEKLTLSTALAIAGDQKTAAQQYEALVTPRLQKLTGLSGEEVLYVAAEGSLTEGDCTAAASALATVLGHKDAEKLMLYLIQKVSPYEPYIAEQLLFMERFNPKEAPPAKVSYTLDGKVINETIDRHGLSLSLSKEQLEAANFKVAAGEVFADVFYTGSMEQSADSSKKKLGITKTITPIEGSISTGKLVKITLTPDLSGFDQVIGDSGLVVDDYIPTGMRFERYGATNQMNPKANWWLDSRQGQRLRFSVGADGRTVPIVYYARCSTPGDYVVEGACISSQSGDIWGASARSTVTITEK
ncbi:MAG: alpha-2-macroglobulin family protein [Angelakisella sp.]